MDNLDKFKTRIDEFWQHQEVLFTICIYTKFIHNTQAKGICFKHNESYNIPTAIAVDE